MAVNSAAIPTTAKEVPNPAAEGIACWPISPTSRPAWAPRTSSGAKMPPAAPVP